MLFSLYACMLDVLANVGVAVMLVKNLNEMSNVSISWKCLFFVQSPISLMNLRLLQLIA